jgi:hypothetical protein
VRANARQTDERGHRWTKTKRTDDAHDDAIDQGTEWNERDGWEFELRIADRRDERREWEV